MSFVDKVLDTLRNGKWHDLMEISEKTQLPVPKLQLLTNFLAEYRFIEIDWYKQRTRLTPSVLTFLKKIQKETANEERGRKNVDSLSWRRINNCFLN